MEHIVSRSFPSRKLSVTLAGAATVFLGSLGEADRPVGEAAAEQRASWPVRSI